MTVSTGADRALAPPAEGREEARQAARAEARDLNPGAEGLRAARALETILAQGEFAVATGADTGAESALERPQAAPLRRLDDALVDPAGALVAFRDVLDLTGNTFAESDLDGRLGPEALVVIDAWQGGSPWLDGAPFVIDAYRIERAAARAAHAAERGAVVALSLASALEPGAAATAILEPGARGAARALLLREAVARFGMLRRLLWLGVSDPGLAQRLAALDPLGRPVFERLPAQTTRAPGAGRRSRAAAPDLEKNAVPSATPSASPRDADADSLDDAVTAAADAKPESRDAKPKAADAEAEAPAAAPVSPRSTDTPPLRRADRGDAPDARPRIAEPKPASEAKPRLARRLADKAPKISLSSFWPIPRTSAAATGAVEASQVEAGEVDSGEVDAEASDGFADRGEQAAQGAQGARAPSPEPGKDRTQRSPPGWREEGSAAIDATLYAIRQRRRGDIEAADRLEISNGLDLASLADASLAVELSGAEAGDVRVVRLRAFDESGAALAEHSEPFDKVALFASPLEDLGGARRFELQARTDKGAPAAKTWTGEVLRPAGALDADADAPSGQRMARAGRDQAEPHAPAPGPRGSALRRPEPSARTAPRLERVDFVDPETDRLLLVWRDGGATPGPLPSSTMIAAVIGRAVSRARHVVATLAFDDAPPLRREAAASVDERGLVCVFYDVALDARVESVTLELFESPDSARPFAVTGRNR